MRHDEILSPIRHWPKWSQALVGLAILWSASSPPEPGPTQHAFIGTFLYLVAVFVLSELLRPKPKTEDARPADLGDFRITTATQGRVVPIIFGTVLQEGPNVIWYGDLVQEAIVEKVKTGLFSSKRVTTGYRYYLGLQFGICRGSGSSVELIRILVGDKEIFSGSLVGETDTFIDQRGLFGGEDLGAGGLEGTFTWRPGTFTQTTVPYLGPFQDIDPPNLRFSRYTGTAYGVFEGGYIGTSTNLEQWKFEVRRIVNPLGLSGGGAVNSGNDMNPMNVLFEFLTNSEWGLGLSSSQVDTTTLAAVGEVLATEGNGMSMLIDNALEGLDFMEEIERQVDGIIFQDQETGLFTIKLARDDYTVGSLPVISVDTNLIAFEDFAQGTWEATTNQVRIKFSNRVNDYADDYGIDFDGANAQIQGGGTVLTVKNVPAIFNYPGIKNAALANSVASRELRSVSTPQAKATLRLTRDMYFLKPGDVFVLNDEVRQIDTLVMRILRIDFGQLDDGAITIDAIKDIFFFSAGTFGDPPPTGWVPPTDLLIAFPVDEQFGFEAPRALRFRDPDSTGVPEDSKIYCAGRSQSSEVEFRITERHASGAPAGDFADQGSVTRLMVIGSLTSNLASGTGVGTTSFIVSPSPDTQGRIESQITNDPDILEKGTDLLNLILIDDEFMLVGAAADSGPNVSMTSVHRGVMDSAQVPHLAGAEVFLFAFGAGLSEGLIPSTNNVDLRLLPRSVSNTLDSASANTISFAMDRRIQRPYCPSRVSMNDNVFDTTAVSLDFLASGAAETTGIDVDFIRRDYRTGNADNEIPPLSIDAATLFSDFPAANSTTSEMVVIDDPEGTPTTLFSVVAIAGTQQDLLRIEVLANTDGVVPTSLGVELRARHDDGAQSGLLSRLALEFTFAPVSAALAGQFVFGARGIGVSSNQYTVDQAGVHNFTLSSATAVGDVEISINGGGFVQLIAQGGTAGATAALVVSDTIDVRHQSTDAPLRKQLDMVAPGGGTDGYFLLIP